MQRFANAFRSVVRQPGFPGLLASGFILGLAYSFVVPFMSLWGTVAVGMRPIVFGLFMTTTSLCAVVINVSLARWSDARGARRNVLLLCATGGILGYLGYAFARDVIALTIIGSLAIGLASSSFSQVFAYAREELGRPENATANRPLLMSLLRAFFSLAWTIGPALGAAVMIKFSYRGIFIAASLLFVVFLGGVFAFVRHRPRTAADRHAAREPLRQVLTRPVILAHFVGFALIFAAFSMNMMNLPLTVTEVLGGSERDVGLIFGISPVFEVPLMIWFGRLAAQGHQVALIRFSALVAVAYFLALSLTRAPWHIYPLQFLVAATIAVTTNVAITFFQDLLPGQAGLATSVYANAFTTGNLVGYFGFGMLVGVVGHRGLFLVCAGLAAVSSAIFIGYRHTAAPMAAAARAA
ncbi:MAG TPA: sugar efflux transporter [Opitutus sp.]|nr:sugar efflux transporter [Opitutus sp.]